MRMFKPLTAADRAQLWSTVAKQRKLAGDREGAKMARWQAASIRSPYPLGKRPEDMPGG